jgi:benzoylformate decarboxylase
MPTKRPSPHKAPTPEHRPEATPRHTVREAVFDLLRHFGMTTVFGNPGSTELPMFKDLPKDFRYVLGLQESIVLGMADGYAQALRRPALVNLHSSAGLGHAMGNLFTAFRNQTPLVVTAGQQARSIMPLEPFLFAQQAIDFPKPFVKWACEPARGEDVPAAIARAYYVAMQPPRGPAFVSIPVDDWERPCDPVASREVSDVIHGDRVMLAAAAEAMDKAECPAIVVGAGVARDDAWDDVIALAETHQAQVWVAPFSSRNGFPEDHRLFAGFLKPQREAIVEALTGCDVILVLGAPVFTYHVEGFGPCAPEGAILFQLVDDPAVAAWAPVGSAIVTSIKPGVAELLARARPRSRTAPKTLTRLPPLSDGKFTDAYLMQQIALLRPKGAVIVEEAPSSRGAMHDYLPILERDTFYTCASGGLGHALPAAVGVALARPRDKVIALLGDGSAMYAIQGLWSAAQLGLAVTFIIVKNNRYEALIEFGRRFGLDHAPGADLPGIDFCALARGQGVAARHVEFSTQLDKALTESFGMKEPSLVEVAVK